MWRELSVIHTRLVKTLDPLALRDFLLLSCDPGVAALHRNCLSYVRAVFVDHTPHIHDPFPWNTMIRAHTVGQGQAHEALALFSTMRRRGVSVDCYTFPLLLRACSSGTSGLHVVGLVAHSLVKLGLLAVGVHIRNALVGFYGGVGLLNHALQLFDEIPHKQRDTVSWSAIINCLTSNGQFLDALEAFCAMQISVVDGVVPDEVTMVSVISAIGFITHATSELAMWAYCYVLKRGLAITVSLGTALVVMFSNLGCIDRATEVFDQMSIRNVRTWTAMINALASNGRSEEALGAFHRMVGEGFRPDHVTFIGILTACSHGGLLEEGTRLFEAMKWEHGLESWMEHYGCMVDLMGRRGMLKEAHEFVKRMPIRPSQVIWRTLLGACVSHGDVVLAEQTKREISDSGTDHDGDYVLLSNAYGGIGQWGEKEGVRVAMRERGIAKTPGSSIPYW